MNLETDIFELMLKKPAHSLFWIILFATLWMYNCTEEPEIVTDEIRYNVAPAFEQYVQEFIEEGAKRGRTINFDDTGLRIQFSDFPLENAAGLCSLRRHSIIIDKENWFRFSERFRSYLLFHELGHCELDRLHKNDQFADNTWKSIMRGNPFKGTNNRIPVPYYGFRREYYNDELFDPNTPSPDWSDLSFSYDELLLKVRLDSIAAPGRLNERFSNPPDEYEFEVNFDLILDNNTRTKLEWGRTGQNYYIYVIPNWGFYIGVNIQGNDNDLFYSPNLNLVNGRKIDKFTIRQNDGYEQVFINETFIFHIDPQEQLDYVKLVAMDGESLNDNFEISSFILKELQE